MGSRLPGHAVTWRKIGPHSDAAHHAIAAELVRLTLGGRPERPELVAPPVDPAARRSRAPRKAAQRRRR